MPHRVKFRRQKNQSVKLFVTSQIFRNFLLPKFFTRYLKTNIETLFQQNIFFKTDVIIHAIIGLRLAGTAISQKLVTATETGAVKANETNILKGFRRSLELTEGWVRNVLKNMYWQKRKENTEKVEPCAKKNFCFRVESLNSFQRMMFHQIQVLNLDQTPLSYVSLGKYTIDLKGSATNGK